MCLCQVNSKEEHQKLVGELDFPCVMYKVVIVDEKYIRPAYNIKGIGLVSLKYVFNYGENIAITEEIVAEERDDATGVDKKTGIYTSGYHIFKHRRDAEELKEMFLRVLNTKKNQTDWMKEHTEKVRVLPVTIMKPEHIITSGEERPYVSCGWIADERSKSKKTTYVASKIHIKQKDYEEALCEEK